MKCLELNSFPVGMDFDWSISAMALCDGFDIKPLICYVYTAWESNCSPAICISKPSLRVQKK